MCLCKLLLLSPSPRFRMHKMPFFFFFANDETGLNAKIKAEATKMLTPRGGEKREEDSAPGYAMEKDTGFCEPQ